MYILPVLHPAYLLRGKWGLEPAQIHSLRQAKALAEGAEYTPVDVSKAPEGSLLDPTLEEIERWFSELSGAAVAVDIETAGEHLVCIGLCAVDQLCPIVIRIRRCGGELAWSGSHLRRIVEHLYRFFAGTIPKVFHNGQNFDVPYLERLGFVVNGYAFDTMLAHFVAYPEMPKGLAFLSGIYLQIPNWKYLVKPDMEGEEKQ